MNTSTQWGIMSQFLKWFWKMKFGWDVGSQSSPKPSLEETFVWNGNSTILLSLVNHGMPRMINFPHSNMWLIGNSKTVISSFHTIFSASKRSGQFIPRLQTLPLQVYNDINGEKVMKLNTIRKISQSNLSLLEQEGAKEMCSIRP